MALVPAKLRGKGLGEADENDVDFDFVTPDVFLGSHASTIPLTNHVAAPRAFYGARFVNQAQPLVARELPHVMRKVGDTDKSFDDLYGKDAGALFADDDGEVTGLDDNFLHLKTRDGAKKIELMKDMPFNRQSAATHYPRVRVGDKVSKGQLLADSSFTKDGSLALGVNANIAAIPYKGMTMDDATVISESFAKKLASDHTYGYAQDYDDNVKLGRDHFAALFPKRFTVDQLKKLDENGHVRPGQVLEKGDPIFLATRPRPISSKTNLGGLQRGVRELRGDASQVWESEEPGRVTDTAFRKGTARAFVHTVKNAKVGDKLALRPGAKMIISQILPDDRILRSKDGKPFDLLLNPLSLHSRVNVNSPLAMLLGKVAARTGKAYRLPGFGSGTIDMVKKELADNGMGDTEEVYDPDSGRMIENPVLTGSEYVIRMHHLAEKKHSARGVGAYDANEQPSRGGGEAAQAKRMSGLETAALLSSGAYGVLREGTTLKGQRNDRFWRDFRSGQATAEPGRPFAWSKFMALLNGAGLHVQDKGKGQLRLGPMTDRHLAAMKPTELQSGDTVDLHDLSPVKGGLFDPVMTEQRKWGSVALPFPVVQPSMEGAVKKLLGITDKQYREVIAGRMKLSEAQAKNR